MIVESPLVRSEQSSFAENLIKQTALTHSCYTHKLFDRLENEPLTLAEAGAMLRNYDAHASVLRRLLLQAATIMPEPAVGFILENVRNEYGNGNYKKNHQAQLRDLAYKIGIDEQQFLRYPINSGVRQFISLANELYFPAQNEIEGVPSFYTEPVEAFAREVAVRRAAIAAGAITATEVLAIKEFVCLQKAFTRFGQRHHIWFHHVTIEEEHSEESLALALYFIREHNAMESVMTGLIGILDANVHLYDGLLEAASA
jgi:hypothetical protein